MDGLRKERGMRGIVIDGKVIALWVRWGSLALTLAGGIWWASGEWKDFVAERTASRMAQAVILSKVSDTETEVKLIKGQIAEQGRVQRVILEALARGRR